ncbi:MAG: helix-turn-helix transcriptional regulator [Spirochaetes bacterium]|nr:helix-turn-helix transcriptional regulator [Spirochaetota bacterium]
MGKAGCSCPVTSAIAVIGGKWKLIIVCRLYDGTRRFGELRKSIEGITTKMLTQQLRELERDGIVHREVFREVPPKVEYTLTKLGLSLKPVVEALSGWGERFEARRRN